jgi:mono/diheme cytochrome c family protein
VLKRCVPIVLTMIVFAAVVQTQQTPSDSKTAPPTEEKIPPEAAQKANPVKPNPEGMAKAKKVYGYDCAMCHGTKGDGKSDMAADLKNLTDFTKPDALKDRTDGELFYNIRKGKGDMPPEGDRAKDVDVWNLVNYIRAMAKK